jgi:Nucleotidyl transferase AbiEii toxin, Type IV TA system
MPPDRRNVGASVRARLLARARLDGTDFQLLLTRYALERLLYRLGVSEHRERFILKGAMLFAAWVDDPFRPTRDIDLLGLGDREIEAITDVFRNICDQEVTDDGVVFDRLALTSAPIRNDKEYGGVRVRTTATINKARVAIQVDIGFGDAVTPRPVALDYPILLDGPHPNLLSYPAETVVAEKFEALVSLGIANTRLKDFYDLWMIANTFEFDSFALREAIVRTFERRHTPIPNAAPPGLSDEFAVARSDQWQAFLEREQMAAVPSSISTVIFDLDRFLMPLVEAGMPEARIWQNGGPWVPSAKERG